MHIIAGIGLGIVLLYGWLVGNWFSRVLMFLVLAAAFGLLGYGFAGSAVVPFNPGNAVFGAIAGVIVAWFVAGVPTYYWRAHSRWLLEAEHQSRSLSRTA